MKQFKRAKVKSEGTFLYKLLTEIFSFSRLKVARENKFWLLSIIGDGMGRIFYDPYIIHCVSKAKSRILAVAELLSNLQINPFFHRTFSLTVHKAFD